MVRVRTCKSKFYLLEILRKYNLKNRGIMEINTYYGRCACCFTYSYLKTMWEEHFWEGKKEIYVQMLVDCFGLSWDPSEESMKRDKICESCIIKLRDANDFKKTVLYSQSRMQCIDEDDSQEEFDDINDESIEDSKKTEFVEVEYLEDEDNKELLEAYEDPVVETDITTDDKTTIKIPKKCPRRSYTKKDLDACVEAVVNKELKLKEASEKYNIPKSTITAKRRSMGIKTEKKSLQLEKPNKRVVNNKMVGNTRVIRFDPVKYRQYTDKDLKECLDAVKNKEITKDIASLKYNIPITTITKNYCKRFGFKDEWKTGHDKNRQENGNKKKCYELKIKTNVRNILKYSNATPFKGQWGIGYACSYCAYQNPSPAKLKTHTLQNHIGVFEAFNVTVNFLDMMIKFDITGLECLICGEEFSHLDKLMVHLKFTHNIELHLNLKQKNIIPFKFDTAQLTCAICNKPFEHFKYLTEHMTDHFRNYECDICGRGFIYEKSLAVHKPRHVVGVFKCSYCDKVFKTRLNMKAHERVLHMNSSRTRKCSYCHERFMDTTQRSKHEVAEHGAEIPSYECKACNKQFFSIIALKTHTKRIHLLLRPHKCDICGKEFFYKYGLKKHQVSHTGARNYQCDICEKRYSSRGSIISHMRIHMDDKRHKCDVCEQAFVQKCSLSIHLKNKHGLNL